MRRRRSTLYKLEKAKFDKINQLKAEIIELRKEDMLLCDKNQWFTEQEEEVLICGRPKKYETKLIGRIHWKETFKDEDKPDGKGDIVVERKQTVRVNGGWL
jgi:hypothetical protein